MISSIGRLIWTRLPSRFAGRGAGGSVFLVTVKRSFSSDTMIEFHNLVDSASHIAIITGAGISAESGIPTYRGVGAYYRSYYGPEIETPETFRSNPGLVWEFYHYRRELILTKKPNAAHHAIVDLATWKAASHGIVDIVTQNIDGLHTRAGSRNVTELHGCMFRTRCTVCKEILDNIDSPICEGLRGRGDPDKTDDSNPPLIKSDLPTCSSCGGLLRPDVVWFGEQLHPGVLRNTQKILDSCDLCLVVGTSSVVYPAAMFAPQVASRGTPVAEFNLETTQATTQFGFHFPGPATEILVEALQPVT